MVRKQKPVKAMSAVPPKADTDRADKFSVPRKQFPVSVEKIPCSADYGIWAKRPESIRLVGLVIGRNRRENRNFPVFFPVSREFAAETSNRSTGSPASQSDNGKSGFRFCLALIGLHVKPPSEHRPRSFSAMDTWLANPSNLTIICASGLLLESS